MARDTYISVWHDETSDGWIVDRCDEHDNSTTVRVFPDSDDDSEGEAYAFAHQYSRQTGLPVK